MPALGMMLRVSFTQTNTKGPQRPVNGRGLILPAALCPPANSPHPR